MDDFFEKKILIHVKNTQLLTVDRGKRCKIKGDFAFFKFQPNDILSIKIRDPDPGSISPGIAGSRFAELCLI